MRLVWVLAMVLAVALSGQQALNNDSIVKLVKAGLSEDMIVQMIGSQPGQYSVSADDIVKLKEAGVPEKVLAAMLSKAVAGTPATGAAQPGAATPAANPLDAALAPVKLPNEIGVYYKKNEEWVEVQPEVVNWKTGGVLKTIATAGIVKGDVNGRLLGANSRNQVRTPVEFVIYAPEGVAITEYQLLRLRVKSDSREFRTVTGGVLHASGGATRDLVPFEGKKLASRTFSVMLPNIGAGEYGFLSPGSFQSSHASAQLGKMYTFRLLE